MRQPYVEISNRDNKILELVYTGKAEITKQSRPQVLHVPFEDVETIINSLVRAHNNFVIDVIEQGE